MIYSLISIHTYIHTYIQLVVCGFIAIISHLSTIAALLHALTHSSVPIQWTIDCQAAFDRMKDMLPTAPVLRAPLKSDFSSLKLMHATTGKVHA